MATAARRNDCRGLLGQLPSRYTAEPGKLRPISTRVRPERVGVMIAMRVRRRNRQSYGQKLIRIRRADARNGGPLPVRRAIVQAAVSGPIITQGTALVAARIFNRRLERVNARLALDLAALSSRHADDPVALARETNKLLYGRHGAYLFTPVLLRAGVLVAAHIVCVIVLPKHQTLPDLAAGIVFVSVEAPSSLER